MADTRQSPCTSAITFAGERASRTATSAGAASNGLSATTASGLNAAELASATTAGSEA